MQTQSKEIDFNGQQFYCGIDTHTKSWTVTIQTEDIRLKTFSQDPKPELLVQYLKRKYPGGDYIVAYEAGYFGYGIYRKFESLGVKCKVLHPADIPTSDKDRDQKRDPRDSKKIANAIKNNEVSSVWVPSVSLEQDRQLLRIREKLSKDKTRIKNRIKAFLKIHGIEYPERFEKPGSHWSGKFIKWLETIELKERTGTDAFGYLIRCLRFQRSELSLISKDIRQLSQNEKYQKAYQILIKIPGLGIVTAMTLLTEIGDIHRFRNVDNFHSFVGVVPRAHDSGEKKRGGKITKRANTYLRYLIVEATWMAIKYNPFYLNIYKTYRNRMSKNKALVRTAVKFTNEIYTSLKKVS